MRIVIVDEARFCGWIIPKLQALLPQERFEEANFLAAQMVDAWQADAPDVVVLTRHSQGVVHERSLDEWIRRITSTVHTRIVLITEPIDPPGDRLMRLCADLGINDVVQAEPIGQEQIVEIADVIQHPKGPWAMAPYRSHHDPHEEPSTPDKRQPIGEASYFKRRPKFGIGVAKERNREPQKQQTDAEDTSPVARPPRMPMSYAVRQLIAVQGMGGGVGSTMVATQLARALTQLGRVLLLDWDARGAVSAWLGDQPPNDHCWETPQMPDVREVRRWAERVWHYEVQFHVLTSNGHFPERPIVWSEVEMDDLIRWAQRQYDYVVVDLGGGWSDPRCAWVTAMADVSVLVSGPYEYHQALALRWQQWTQANEWLVADRHLWVGVGYGITKTQKRQWERVVGERWTSIMDRASAAEDEPLRAILAAVTTRAAIGVKIIEEDQ